MQLYNLARMTVSGTPGTGDITLGVAATGGYLTFNQAQVPNGARVSYGAKDGSNLEVGRALYNSGTLVLSSREPAITSAGNQTPLNLSSATVISIVALAEDFEERLSPIAQIRGTNDVALAQVEAATRALRVTPKTLALDDGWVVNHYHAGRNQTISLTTASMAGAPLATFAMPYSGIACLNKFIVTGVVTSAVVGARVGPGKLTLRKALYANTPIQDMNVGSPNASPWPDAPMGGAGLKSLFGRQAPALMTSNLWTTAASTLGRNDELAEAPGGFKSTPVGDQNFGNVTLFDAWESGQYKPLILLPGNGFELGLVSPAAVTSQSLDWSAIVQWDEWVPFQPDFH
jgi:hypothetical protein